MMSTLLALAVVLAAEGLPGNPSLDPVYSPHFPG